jgi:hypothetical protein
MDKISDLNSAIWFFGKYLEMGRKFSKTAITLEGRAVGRNPFRLFIYSRSSIEWCMNERNRSGAPGNVFSLARAHARNMKTACSEIIGVSEVRKNRWFQTRNVLIVIVAATAIPVALHFRPINKQTELSSRIFLAFVNIEVYIFVGWINNDTISTSTMSSFK